MESETDCTRSNRKSTSIKELKNSLKEVTLENNELRDQLEQIMNEYSKVMTALKKTKSKSDSLENELNRVNS